jgi:hypothetical protein
VTKSSSIHPPAPRNVPESPTPTPARLWGDQWLRVSEKVLKGLNHQLSNRVAAIEALTMMMEPDGPPPEPAIIAALNDEVGRLSGIMRLYRLLPPEPTAAPEPVRPQDIVPQVLALHEHHSDLRKIACDLIEAPDAEPVLVRPSALLRSLLVILESVAGHSTRAGSSDPITFRCVGDAERVTITMEGASPTAEPLTGGDHSLLAAVRGTLAHAGVELEAVRGPRDGRPWIRYDIVLPTLREARRREQGAA